jgi:PPM family protein phosphatase
MATRQAAGQPGECLGGGRAPCHPSIVQYAFTSGPNRPIKDTVYDLDFAARTDRGLVREMNQDVARVCPGLGLALVADGMGGHAHGNLASQAAADGLEQSYEALGGAGADIDETAQRLLTSFAAANRRIAEHPKAGEGWATMGTTLVAAALSHGRAAIGNVGDSRCYRLRGGTFELLTDDHSYAAELKQQGVATLADGSDAADRYKNMLTRCLDGKRDIAVDMRIVRCEPGDVFLLCSDGLWGSAHERVIADILKMTSDADEACQRLIGAAWAGGGIDNIGVAVIRLVARQLRPDKPSTLNELPEQPASDA